MTDVVAILANGLVYGSIYGLVAIGMTLIYGTLRILDMSQGSMVMAGGYVGWWALSTHGFNPVVALVVAFVLTFALGTATELVSVQPLIGRAKQVDLEMVTFITTFADQGSAPFGLAITPDGSKVYVANQASGTVSVIATATNMVLGSPIPVGRTPSAFGKFIGPVPTFAGTPGFSNCQGQSVAALFTQFGSLNAAAAALGFSSVHALQTAIRTFCQV